MMKELVHYAKIYYIILGQDIKSKMSYRVDFIISVFGMLFTNISGILAFWIIFQNFDGIAGYGYYDILFLYGFSLIALTPSQCILENNWNLQRYLYSGDFIKYCFRPLNIFFYFISEVFDLKGISQLLCGIAILAFSWMKLGIACSVATILLLLLGLFTASVFMMAMLNIAATACFLTINLNFLIVFTHRLREYARYPLPIYKPIFRFVFTYIIPLAFATYYPSLFVLDTGHLLIQTILSPLIGLVWLYLSYKLWMYGAMKYNGTGS